MSTTLPKSHLPLPRLLREMLADGRWRQPSEAALSAAIPFLHEPVVFLLTEELLQANSATAVLDDPGFRLYRGSECPEKPLPWLDVEKQIFLAINRVPGDDVAIALDYRSSLEDPRVVASEWDDTGSLWRGCQWREVSPSFSAFVSAIQL